MDDHYKHKLYSKENRVIRFSDDVLAKVNAIIARYPADRKKSAILPVLHVAQEP